MERPSKLRSGTQLVRNVTGPSLLRKEFQSLFNFPLCIILSFLLQVLPWCCWSPACLWHCQTPDLWECGEVVKGASRSCWSEHRNHAGEFFLFLFIRLLLQGASFADNIIVTQMFLLESFNWGRGDYTTECYDIIDWSKVTFPLVVTTEIAKMSWSNSFISLLKKILYSEWFRSEGH